MLNWDDGQSTTRRPKHYGIHEKLLVNSWTQLFLQNWSGNLIGAGAMQEHHVTWNFFCCTTTSWRVEENLITYLLNYIGPYEGVGPLLYILQTANNSGTWGQRPGAFPKGDNRSHFNFAHKRRNASRGDQVRHVVVYDSTSPLWIFQQRESSSSWRPPSSTPGSK